MTYNSITKFTYDNPKYLTTSTGLFLASGRDRGIQSKSMERLPYQSIYFYGEVVYRSATSKTKYVFTFCIKFGPTGVIEITKYHNDDIELHK